MDARAVHSWTAASTPLNIFQPRAPSSTHVQLDDMSQHPQQTVHYTPLALNATEGEVTKQKGKHVAIDDDDEDDVDIMDHHQHRRRSFTSPRRSSGRLSRSRSRRNGSLTDVYAVDEECTGLITPNGMEVALATVDQKRRKWWKDAIINLCFIAGWYVDEFCGYTPSAYTLAHSMLVPGAGSVSGLAHYSRYWTVTRFFFATLLSVYNKWMFSLDRFAFPYPLFVTSLHMLVQFILAGILRYSLPRHFKPELNPKPKDYA
jgi:hypothetical protein